MQSHRRRSEPVTPTPVGHLILRTRVQVLKANLEKIKGIRDSIERVRGAVRDLVELPNQQNIGHSIEAIRQAVVKSKAEVQRRSPSAQVIWDSLDSIEAETQSLEAYVTGAETLVSSIETRLLSVAHGELGTELESELEDKAEAKIKALDALVASIEAAARQQDNAAQNAHQEGWRQYSDPAIYGESQEIFREYVDLLGGLALRDSGFDEGICRIADELIRACASRLPEFGWNSLTIPARQEALKMTMARIIRLGFPEWTIWTLPLAAHELGHVVAVGRIARLLDEENQAGFDKNDTRICFADAFATFVMGPAYACAAILMRFDPFRAITSEDDHLTLQRAECTLQMLEAMNRAAGRTNPYGGIVKRLRDEWEDAVMHAAATIPDNERQHLEGSQLSEDERAHIGRIADFVMNTFGRRGFPASGWALSADWATSLATDGGASIDPSPVDIDLRYVPNAAWRLRFDSDDFESLGQAAEAAVRLWSRLERRLGEEPDKGWGPIDTGTRATTTLRNPKPAAAFPAAEDGGL